MIEPGEGPRTTKYLNSLPVEQRRRLLRIPPAYADASIELLDHPAHDAVLAYAEAWGTGEVPKGKGLRIVGPSGTGKTTLATVLLRDLVDCHPVAGTFVTSRMFLDMTMADYGNQLTEVGYKDPHALVHINRRFEVLVLDGLGEERKTPQSDSILHELLRNRGDYLLTTIVTTTLSLDAIAERYGEMCAAYLERTTLEVATDGG